MTFSNVKGLLRKRSIYILSLSRLVIAPMIVILIFRMLKSFGVTFDSLVTLVIILEISMPCMASVVIMARELDADENMAMANVFVSTFISIITLPLILIAANALI